MASRILFFSGLSARKRYPSITVESIERKPRRVEVMSPNCDISVNPMSALTAPMKDAMSRGTRKSFFTSFKKISWEASNMPIQTMRVVKIFRIV